MSDVLTPLVWENPRNSTGRHDTGEFWYMKGEGKVFANISRLPGSFALAMVCRADGKVTTGSFQMVSQAKSWAQGIVARENEIGRK
jgi:hypothetical protein